LDSWVHHKDYFADFLSTRKSGIFGLSKSVLTADITPAYCFLSKNVLKIVKQGLEKSGLDYRIVFLARDPVRRVESAARKFLFPKVLASGVELDASSISKVFREYSLSPACQVRTRYENTILNFRSTFGEDAVYVGFYELIGGKQQAKRLGRFLGVPSSSLLSPKVVNPGEKQFSLTQEDVSFVADHYRETYEFFAKEYPHSLELWGSTRHP
jgi:hypothetical protein